VFDAVSYAASCVSLLLMRARFEEPRVSARQHPLRELAEGVGWVARHRLLRKTSFLGAINDAVINSLFLVVIVAGTRHGGSAPEIGAALAFMGVGGLVGALIATRLARILSVRQVLVGSLATVTILLPLVAMIQQPVLIGVVYGAMFVPFPTWNAVIGAYQLAVVPDRLQARVQSVTTLMHLGSVPLAALVVGLALERTSTAPVVAVLTGLMAVAVVVAATSRAIGSARSFDALGPQEPTGDDAILARA
jgi:predicted MFS family arabinose efflux permease